MLFILASSSYLTAEFTPSITAVPGQPFSTEGNSYGIAYSPNGKWLAQTNSYTPDTSTAIFLVGSNGALTEIAGSPFIGSGLSPEALDYSPDGRFLAVANYCSNTVDIFSVNQSSGALQLTSSTGISTQGVKPETVIYSPNGKLLAIANSSSGSIIVFPVTTHGTLSSLPALTTLANPGFNIGVTDQMAFSPDNNFLATVSYTHSNGSVSVFSVNQTTGVLSGQQNFIIGSQSITSVAYSPNGKFLAAVDHGNTTTIFKVNAITGALAKVSSISNSNAAGYQTVSFSPDGHFIAVGNTLNGILYGNIAIYSIDQAGALTQFGSLLATGIYPANLVFSPVYTNGVSYVSMVNEENNTISSYAFSLMQPMGPLAAAIRNKYLLNK